MTYPCGIIKDLLPLYIDEVCNEESKQAVTEHLAECTSCQCCYEAMKMAEGGVTKVRPEDVNLANSLKRVKNKLNKKIATIICSVAAVALLGVVGYHLLFNVPIKNVSLDDVSFSANVYSFEELIEDHPDQEIDPDTVSIFADDHDDSEMVAVRIPEIGDALISVSEEVINRNQHLSILSVHSDYFLRTILKERVEDTIYVTAIKTTLLNNKTEFQNNFCGMEFGEINRIIFVDDDGTETVLWSR